MSELKPCPFCGSDKVKVLNYQVRDDKWGDNNYLSDHYALETTVRIYNYSENIWTGFH